MLGNSVHFIGRMTNEPELRAVGDHNILHFTLARDRYNPKSEERVSDFLDLVAFGKTAETISKYVKKGDRLGIDGHIQVSSYESKKFVDDNGNPARLKRTDVVVDNIEFLQAKGSGTGGSTASSAPAEVVEDEDDDLPF